MRIGDEYFLNISSPSSKVQSTKPFNDDEEAPGKFDELFSTVFAASDGTSRELSAASRESTALLMTGQLDDLTGHMVTGEKSNMAFEMNLTVRNKVLDAYAEIMKTQV